MNNKYFRYILGFILLALILSSFCFSRQMLFFVSVFFIVVTMIEYRTMFKFKDIYPHKFIPEIIGIMCAYVFSFTEGINDHSIITPILLLGIIVSFFVTVLKNKKPYIMTSLTTIVAFLLIFCGLYIIKLTYYFEQYYVWQVVCIYFLAVLSGDFMASRIGKKFNKHKLAREISPNKTIAGAVANLVFSCLSCMLFKVFIGFSFLQCLELGVVISVFSQFGDLTLSTFKRDLGIKHSGSLFYEYGGILDRMDSFLFSAPALYYLLFTFQAF